MGIKTRKISSLVIFIVCISMTIIGTYASANRGVKSLEALSNLESVVISYNQHEYRGSISYKLRLKGYTNIFNINPDYLKTMALDSLISEIEANEVLTFAIKKKDLAKLQTDKTIQILGLWSKNKVHLDKVLIMGKDRRFRRIFAPIFGVVMFILSVGVYVYRRYYYKYDI